jgi:hypothetical protein
MSTTKQHGTKSIFNAVWHNRWVQQALVGSALTALLMPIGAAQAATGAPGSFEELGAKMWEVVCKFIASPLVAVVVGISILALLFVMAMNEDNGMLSKVVKVLLAAMCIVFLPSLMALLGFDVGC